jgi:glycosyltransferase involved in cell wall biosynthesis
MASEPSTRVDLVVGTVGRVDELARCLTSIEAQTFRDFRVIVVDQNPDDRVDSILSRRDRLSIVRLRCPRGANRARNAALSHVRGDIVAFPDDDCRYPPALLEEVVRLLDLHPEWDGLSVRSVDSTGRPSNMRWDRVSGPIDKFNIWRRAIAYGIFLRRGVLDAVGEFNEELGPGSGTRWGSGDETDYLLRVLAGGFSVQYEPSLHVEHESPSPPFSPASYAKAYAYGVGNGRVLRDHGYPRWFVTYRVLQLAGGALLFLVTGRLSQARFYAAMAAGRATGWLTTHPERRPPASA